ncbi:MAG: hypothetical protein PUP46_01060 [Endozoicomonas sp. (ex Botrylloides leachii)]|nr:hypothetical protein [Endozoicomonas sp. (ex Botrylloides leachii)]
MIQINECPSHSHDLPSTTDININLTVKHGIMPTLEEHQCYMLPNVIVRNRKAGGINLA